MILYLSENSINMECSYPFFGKKTLKIDKNFEL